MTETTETTRVHPTAIIEPGAELGVGVDIGPYAIVGRHARLGDRTRLHPHAIIQNRVALGADNDVFAGAVIGGTPQDKTYHGEETEVAIGDRNQIREYCTIHVGTAKGGELTRIGDDNLFMGGTHIAHDCQLGDRITIGNNTLIAGHVRIENDATVCGGTGLHHWCTVGEFAFVGALARIAMDVPPYLIVEGRPGRVRGLNIIGLRRGGVTGDRLDALRDAYKILFHTSETREAALRTLEGGPMTREVEYLVTCLRHADRGYKGRYREAQQRGFAPLDPAEPHGEIGTQVF